MIKHYKNRSLKNIKGEKWKWIPGYTWIYQASTKGRIKSFMRNFGRGPFIMKQRVDKLGYLKIGLRNKLKPKGYFAHQLICLTFKTNPHKKPFVNHLKGIKWDNRPSQLRWCTQQENITHSIRHGFTNNKGENSKCATLSNKDAVEIYRSNMNRKDLSKKYGVAVGIIHGVKTGRVYACATGAKYNKKYNRLRKDKILEISSSNGKDSHIAKKFGVSVSSVIAIRRGYRHSNITGIKLDSIRLKHVVIRRVFKSKLTYPEISKKYNVSNMSIYLIKRGKRHSNITSSL